MIGGEVTIKKKVVMAYLKVQYYAKICLQRLRKGIKFFG